MAAPTDFLTFTDKNADAFIARLSEAVEIPRLVLCQPHHDLEVEILRISL